MMSLCIGALRKVKLRKIINTFVATGKIVGGFTYTMMVKAEKESVAALTEKYAGYGDLVAVEEGQAAVDTPADVMETPKERQGLSDWGIIGIAAVVAVLIAVLLTRAIDKSRAKK